MSQSTRTRVEIGSRYSGDFGKQIHSLRSLPPSGAPVTGPYPGLPWWRRILRAILKGA